MSQQIIEVLDYLFEKFGIAIDWTSENIMPYIHLPIQSGSDKILKKMNRRYTAKEYKILFDKMRKRCSGFFNINLPYVIQ